MKLDKKKPINVTIMAVAKLVLLVILLAYLGVALCYKYSDVFRKKIVEELEEKILDNEYMNKVVPNILIVNSSVPTLLFILLLIFG